VISLRHHIFSLVAVFVALAIGIAAGSTVVRGPLLDSLRSRLESAEQLIETERAENDELAAEVAQLDQLGQDAPAQFLAGRLDGTAVLLVVAGAVDVNAVRGVLRSLEAASAEVIGEIRIDDVAFDPEQSARLAEAIGVAPGEAADVADSFGARMAQLLMEMKQGVEARGPTTEVASRVFGDLEDSGVVDLLRLRSEPVAADTFDVVLLVDRNLERDPGPVLRAMVEPPAVEADDAIVSQTMLVAEVGRVALDNESPAPSLVADIRESGRLRDEISTVDNAETVLGWMATVLGLQSAQRGDVGHYGFRDGAEGSIPAIAP
jgi:hypothetical protein